MITKKPQTIQGFLTPNKLLSATSKNIKQNSKPGKSPITTSNQKPSTLVNSRYNSQNQSILNTSRQVQSRNPQTGDINNSRFTGQNVNFTSIQADRKYESQSNIPWAYHEQDSRINQPHPDKKSPFSIAEQDQIYNNKQRTLQEINNRKWDTTAIRYEENRPYDRNPRSKNDITGGFNQNYSKAAFTQGIQSNSLQYRGGPNSEVMTVQCYQLIRKLSKIKQNLQLQILELQTLLDNTSKHMDRMDEQFQKIKDSILTYTASCLDSAFAQYKENMVEWQKYEDFERKSLTMLSQINEFIYNQEQILSESSQKPSYREMTATGQQLQRQIQYYGQFTEEIKRIRQQCFGMRPTLTEDRVKQFEKGLAILCNF